MLVYVFSSTTIAGCMKYYCSNIKFNEITTNQYFTENRYEISE